MSGQKSFPALPDPPAPTPPAPAPQPQLRLRPSGSSTGRPILSGAVRGGRLQYKAEIYCFRGAVAHFDQIILVLFKGGGGSMDVRYSKVPKCAKANSSIAFLSVDYFGTEPLDIEFSTRL